MFVALLFLRFAQCVDFLNSDLAIGKLMAYLCIANFKKTKQHPYTEGILVTESCCTVDDCSPNSPQSCRSFRD